MELCESCQQPQALHLGYDHGKGKCLLAHDALSLSLKFGMDKATEVIRQAKAWYKEQELSRDNGAGI